jgi:hypothetical protein
MSYKITFIKESGKWEMNGIVEKCVGNHLYEIAKEHGVQNLPANSETHHLHILRSLGIDIQLVEEDGRAFSW